MSSVAVLTQESFAEHRSGLAQQQVKVTALNSEEENDPPTYKEAFPPLPEKAPCLEAAQEPAGPWSKIRPIKASVITQVFHVPLEERKYKDMNQFGEGEQAKICLDIMQKTGAHLELSLAKDQGLSIMVSGKLEAVMKARKEIVARLQTQASATVAIPKEHHRFVIGKNGEKLQDLELKTATKIQIPRPDDPSNQIKITGTKEGIEKARHEILLISAEQDKRAVERLDVEKVYHPFIAGPYNKLVSELMQETGTRINIPPPSVNKTEIVFTGEKEQLAQAVARVKKIYEEKKKKTTTIAVEVKKSQHKYVIGPKGNSLQEILEKTGVSVEIPPTDSSSETVILRGEPEKLGQALTEVYAKANSFTVSSVSAPSWLHRFIIGKKGQNLAKITQQMPKVHIEFTEGEDKITLEGPTEDVNVAQEQIEVMVKDLINRMDYAEINVDHKFHRHLIGKNGANINRIKDLYKVSVRIPPDNEKSNLIRIEGDPQGVQQAKKELLELASRMENERTKDLIIEQKFHRTIIGQKGERIREIREKFPEVRYLSFLCYLSNNFAGMYSLWQIREESNTKIDLPAENSNSETIVITGKKANCEAARHRILAIQKELVEVSIPSKLHNSLIGAKGRFIRSIMEECGGVHIHFPTEGSGSDTVTIRGPAQDVEKAKKQLLHLAEEKVSLALQGMEHVGLTSCLFLEVEVIPSVCMKGFGVNRTNPFLRDLNTVWVIKTPVVEPAVQENGEEGGEGKEGKDTDPSSPKKCDIIIISGRREKCEAAKEALQALVPVTIEVEVPFDLHRYIIGQKGSGIRKMMDEFEVNIQVPAPELQSDIITITGLATNLDRAKAGLLERVKELQAEQEDRALRSFKLTVTVDPKYHPKIIGRKGAVITQIRTEHEVNIQFPDKDDESQAQDQITITGYEKNAEAARDAIMKIVGELEQMVSEDVTLDHRVHARIIGARGKAIRKIMDEFKVDIRFPQSGAPDPNCVTVTGLPENVEEAIDHILNLEEEYLADVVDNEAMQVYMKPSSHEESKAPSKGFVVRDAPWATVNNEKAPDMSSSEDFPSFGAQVAPKTLPWGPKR
uniref:Vigilin n=1 Tax=Zonotrichia albicollis TaxID=44394 RepID=A0A8D2MER1_ZONAL